MKQFISCVGFCVAMLLASKSHGSMVTLSAVNHGSIQDASSNGFGGDTVFDGSPNSQLPWVHKNSSATHRFIAEYDLASLPGNIQSVTLKGFISGGNSAFNDLASVLVSFYNGNGSIELADYDAAATDVYSFDYQQPNTMSLNRDVTSEFLAILGSGASHLGLRMTPQNDQNVSNVHATLEITHGSAEGVPEPASLAMWSVMGGIGFVVRRKRKKA